MWLTQDQQRVWRKYLTMTSGLQTAMNRQLQRDCGLSLADYDVLVALSEGGPQRISDLGHALGWEQSRLSHQLRRMRGRDLVARHGSGDDRRAATVELTDAGLAVLQAAAAGHVELVRRTVFAGVSRARLRAFESAMDEVLERLPAD